MIGYYIKTIQNNLLFKYPKQNSFALLLNLPRRTFCSCGSNPNKNNLSEKQLNFKGVHVKIEHDYENEHRFESDLIELLTKWRSNGTHARRSAFLEVPIHHSKLIPIAARHGFSYHHARDHTAMLAIWLDTTTTSKLPQFANHTLGVAGCCFHRETMSVLLVQDKGRYSKWWKFPGGFAERGEYIGETAVRETYEETGVTSKFESVLNIREQHGTSFGQSDFYVVCRLRPLSLELFPCASEIDSCEWVGVDEVLQMPDTTPQVKLVCQLLKKGVETSFTEVDIVGQEVVGWSKPPKNYYIYTCGGQAALETSKYFKFLDQGLSSASDVDKS